MTSNLYEILGLDSNASPEQIRKAYKKKALETHPDRFSAKPAAEKSVAEEEFRKVNNAYEVLNDPQNRRVYDLHGVWPPPETFDAPPRRGQRHNFGPSFDFHTNFNDSARHGFGAGGSSMPPGNPFTDPFVLFNSMFGELNRHMHDPFVEVFDQFDGLRGHGRPRHEQYERDDVFSPGGPGPSPFNPTAGMGMFTDMGTPGGAPQRFRTESSFRSSGGRYGFRRESRVTTTVNGVTHSTWTRLDSDGNEHITRMYPDGREVHTINGVEQGPQCDTTERFIPPPPRDMRGSDGYPPQSLVNGPPPSHHHSHEYDGPYNTAAVYPDHHWDQASEPGFRDEREPKRRWWHGRR